MIDKKVTVLNEEGKLITGKVLLVYDDAIASGSNEYINITMLSVKDKKGTVHHVRPRDIKSVLK